MRTICDSASILVAASCLLAAPAHAGENALAPESRTGSLVYREDPRRRMVIFYPEAWKPTDTRPALVIFRCQIPEQREYFRKLGMVIIKPGTAPVNSGKLPGMSLEDIAASPKPRDQVADTKSAIRFIRAQAGRLGVDPRRIVATGTSGGADLALQSHLNLDFEHPDDDAGVSPSPDALVLYAPAFDGIDIWFVKNATLRESTRKEAPGYLPLLERFVVDSATEYARPRDHRAGLIALAEELGKEKGISGDEIRRFQEVLGLFNERDWQLLHPAEDALKMSASRILTRERALPPTLILLGGRDHLAEYQDAFVKRAREMGQEFDLTVYPDGGHSFMMQPAFIGPSNEAVRAFLRRHAMLPGG